MTDDFIKFSVTFVKSWFSVLCLAFKYLDDVLQPTVPPPSQRAASANQPSGKILANDLDSSLANLVGSKHEAFNLFSVTKSNKQANDHVSMFFPPSQILALEELHPKSKCVCLFRILLRDFLVGRSTVSQH